MIQPEAEGSKRVLAAGLSPAWQQIMVFDAFEPWKVNRASEVHWCASGKVLNVGIALAQLSHNSNVASRTLSVIGPRARPAIESEFTAIGVDCRWIETEAETRICTTILDRASGQTTELIENAHPLKSDDLLRYRRAFEEDAASSGIIVLTGSLPPDVPITFYRDLLRMTTARVVLDIRGPELLAALDSRPFCVKPNREELCKTFGRDLKADNDLLAAMQELNRLGAEWVVVTQGADPVWVSRGNDLYRFDSPAVESIVNPIGSGDCLAAGIAWAIAQNKTMLDAIRFGIAAAADNVTQLLPARLDRTRIAKLEANVRLIEAK